MISATKQRVLISSYGSHVQGLGHIVREISLYRVLQNSKQVIFHAEGVPEQVYELLHKEGVRNIVKGTLRQALRKYRPKLMIYDKPYALGEMEDISGIPLPPVIALDYFYYHDPRVHVAINVYNHKLKKNQKIAFGKIYEGMVYAIVREEILRYRSQARNIRSNVQQILVTFGGADPRNNTQESVRILERLSHSPFSVHIIRGSKFRKGIHYLLGKYNQYQVHTKVEDLGGLMSSIDLAFCGAGVTLAELMALGRPCIVIPQNGEELKLAQSIAKKDAVLLLHPQHGSIISRTRTVQKLVEDWRRRERMGRWAKQLVDGRGRERVIDIVGKEIG